MMKMTHFLTPSAYRHAAGVSEPVYASQMARTKSSVSYPMVQLYHSPPSRMHTGTPSMATVHDLLYGYKLVAGHVARQP